jgi:SAM-dependent methyltransferase
MSKKSRKPRRSRQRTKWSEAEKPAKSDGYRGVFVGVPRAVTDTPECRDTIDEVILTLAVKGLFVGISRTKHYQVAWSRNRLCEAFLKSEAKYLLMLDADMFFPAQTGVHLYNRAENNDLEVLCGLYFSKSDLPQPHVYRFDQIKPDEWGEDAIWFQRMSTWTWEFMNRYDIPYVEGHFYSPKLSFEQACTEIHGAGTGCMLIRRDVLERMKPPWFHFKYGTTSEDMTFCYDAMKAGVRIWVDAAVIPSHLRLQQIGAGDFRAQYGKMLTDSAQVTLKWAIEDLSEYLEEPAEDVLVKIRQGANNVNEAWKEANPQTVEEIDQFYRQEKGYLYDLANWNATPFFHSLISSAVGYEGKLVLDFGGGIGTAALAIAEEDQNRVHYLDLPGGALWDFAKWRFEKRNPKIEVVEEVKPGIYDAILCFDVLEHVKDMEPVFWKLCEGLKPGGKLHCHNNFGQQDIYPMHFDHKELWEKLVEESGLKQMSDHVWEKT